ncbi:hypothetical protein DAEQUDRAFT_406504 [Daedalea quercina L-15889]|uniref:Uncharacterized protein n=1 Tax=Daedalea quercina L-15889 TaxID=1314783 RepID=A0A165NN98_9APHY|nr:hypothetical protein DAEQUDRAFT_406504 [Daedalea quercina L-15889]
MSLPGNDAVSSGARMPSTQVEPSSTIRADVIHSQPLSGAHRADTQHTETERPRKKRKKLKHDSSIHDLTKGRSASNPPPKYVPPTPDPLASSPGPFAVQTTSQISSTGVPTNIMNGPEASANRDSLKKRKRKSMIEPDVASDPDPDVVVATASSPIEIVPPPRESPVHVPKQRRWNPRPIFSSLTSDAARTTALPLHVENAPPADLPFKKRKTEKVQSGAVDFAQPSSEDCPDKGVQPEVKKSKSRKNKKTEGRPGGMVVVQADGTQEQTAGPPSAEPVKRSKKAKHAEALDPNADVQLTSDATPELTVADDAPVVVKTGKKKEKRKTKKKTKYVDESATR